MLPGIAPRAAIPQDVVGVIMEFFTPNLRELHDGPASVSKRWHSAFLDHQPLWRYFCRQRWPKTLRKDLTVEVYKKRRTVEIDCAPIQPSTFSYTEIENCGFEFAFKCPMVAEMLSDTGEGPSPDKPILHCDACDKHVYTCTTMDELEENVAQERCVRFSRSIIAKSAGKVPVTCFVPFKDTTQKHQIDAFFRVMVAGGRGSVTSATLDPLRLQVDEPDREGVLELHSIPFNSLKDRLASRMNLFVIGLDGFFKPAELEYFDASHSVVMQSPNTPFAQFHEELIEHTIPCLIEPVFMGMIAAPDEDLAPDFDIKPCRLDPPTPESD